MKNGIVSSKMIGGIPLLVAMAGALFGAGCASGPPPQELTLRSIRHDQTFTQRFSGAYFCRTESGDIDLVLADRAADGAAAGHMIDAPVREIMHVRILWNPRRDQKTDHSSASNASIHWYVIGNTHLSTADVLEYAGTASVKVDDSDDPIELTIRNAAVEPIALRGGLVDPVGVSTLQGTIRAHEDHARVNQLLESVRTVVTAANSLPRHIASAQPESPSSLAR